MEERKGELGSVGWGLRRMEDTSVYEIEVRCRYIGYACEWIPGKGMGPKTP